MIAEDLEFHISQYVDGTLSPAEMQCVDDLIAADPQAKKVLADYCRLNGELTRVFANPSVDWETLSTAISSRIEQHQQTDPPAVAGRIGFGLTRLRIAAALTMAATALIVTRLATQHNHLGAAPATALPSVSIVTGPQAEAAAGTPTADISVGPSPALAARDSRYGEGVIGRGPSRVVIVGMAPKKPADPHLH